MFVYIVVSSTDESFMDETRLLLLLVGSLVTLHTFVFTHITSAVKAVQFFMAKSRAFKSRLKAELGFYRFVHFDLSIYLSIYI